MPIYWLLSAASHCSSTAFQVKMNITFMWHRNAVSLQLLCRRVQCGNTTQLRLSMNGPSHFVNQYCTVSWLTSFPWSAVLVSEFNHKFVPRVHQFRWSQADEASHMLAYWGVGMHEIWFVYRMVLIRAVIDVQLCRHVIDMRKLCRCRHEKYFTTYIVMLFQSNGTRKYLRYKKSWQTFQEIWLL